MRLPKRVAGRMTMQRLTTLMSLIIAVFGVSVLMAINFQLSERLANIEHQNTKLRLESRLKTAAIIALELTIETRNNTIASCRSQAADDAMNIVQLKATIAQNEANNVLLATARGLDWGIGWYVEEAFAGPMSTIVVKSIPGMKKRSLLPDTLILSFGERSLEYRRNTISDGSEIYSLTDDDPPPT